MIGPFSQFEPRHCLPRALSCKGAVLPHSQYGRHDVIDHCQVWDEIKLLKNKTNFCRPKAGALGRTKFIRVFSVDENIALVWFKQPSGDEQDSGFAAAARTLNGGKFVGRQAEIGFRENWEWALRAMIGLGQVFQFKQHFVAREVYVAGAELQPEFFTSSRYRKTSVGPG